MTFRNPVNRPELLSIVLLPIVLNLCLLSSHLASAQDDLLSSEETSANSKDTPIVEEVIVSKEQPSLPQEKAPTTQPVSIAQPSFISDTLISCILDLVVFEECTDKNGNTYSIHPD